MIQSYCFYTDFLIRKGETIRHHKFGPRKKVTPEQLIKIVAAESEITVRSIQSTVRLKHIVEARFLVAHFAYHHLKMSLDKTAELIGGRHHTSVMHALKQVSARYQTEQDYRTRFRLIEWLIDKAERG